MDAANNTIETAAQQYRREVREGRAVAIYRRGFFYGVTVCNTAEEAAAMAAPKIGAYPTRFEVLTRPVNILKAVTAARKELDAAEAAHKAGK